MKRSITMLAALALLFLSSLTMAQEKENKSEVDFGGDFVSRYVWRGTDFGNSPAIQPSISYSISGFEIGTWGSYAISANFQEIDLYASYTFVKDMFTLGVTDYYVFDADTNNNHYFDWTEGNTNHFVEGNLKFNGTEKVPIYFSANYFFYGADPDNSWYFELGYNGNCRDFLDYSIFVGASVGQNMYVINDAEGFNVVNCGFTLNKDVKITEKWSLPLFTSFIVNPQAENVFLVFGFTL